MLAALIALSGVGAGSAGKAPSLGRFEDGERGAVPETLGFCCEVKSSLMVRSECLRFFSACVACAEDIGDEEPVTLRRADRFVVGGAAIADDATSLGSELGPVPGR